MDDFAHASALALASVFAWAGVAKTARPRATASSFASLRLPAPALLARLVPAVEIALAVGLLLLPAVAGWAALALVAAFTAVLLRALAAGVRAPCSCFGSARKEPVSSTEILRNAFLAALAIIATGAADRGWPSLPALVVVTVAIAVVRVVLASLDLRRATGHIWPRVPGAAR